MEIKNKTNNYYYLSLFWFSLGTACANEVGAAPVISIIIDGIGYHKREDLRAIAIP